MGPVAPAAPFVGRRVTLQGMQWRRMAEWLATAGMAVLVGGLLLAMVGAAVLGAAAIVGAVMAWASS